ncbi:D-alanine--D-alanine ligase [Olsenella sp. An290]|uniref:D-alanine--D-alanine ligase family protein n=1 Tax=Olsenella sp. An290 TaxID=1965625 RepID=UPI000B372059|nr:D-alanine--D-alanine ligase [Olsenella sp. An290]OUO34454.1 D-alanine--D-alanine ligase [Olsenella sp. An290]
MDREELLTKRVVVVCGGWSDEREISLSSARECQAALREAGFTTVDLLDLAESDFVTRLARGGYDVAFVAMHGRYGEDGCVQGLLEILHIPYTFSGVAASAVGSEKELSKAVYASAGIRAPRGVDVAGGTRLTEDQIDEVLERLGLPLFVKPAANGSSYGITRVTDRAVLNDAIALAGADGGRVLIEECVEGTEITVPVIGNDDARALPIVEIVTGAEFYDLKVKYEPSALHHVIPARLEAGVYAKAQDLAVRAHRALGCRGCSRSDFIVTPEGVPVILETNTIPGMTAESLLPDSARHGGIEFPELCARFVAYALEGRESAAGA